MRIVSGQSGTAWLHCDAGVASRLFFFFDFYPKWVPRQFGRRNKNNQPVHGGKARLCSFLICSGVNDGTFDIKSDAKETFDDTEVSLSAATISALSTRFWKARKHAKGQLIF